MKHATHTQKNNPVHYEIERKFLIEYPNVDWLNAHPSCQCAKTTQTYLKSETDEEIRVRERIADGQHLYFHTAKRKVSDAKRIEIEREISCTEYKRFLQDADTTKRQICKTRYCLTYEKQCFEIDVYPFWQDKAIVEIELCDENAPIVFPNEIKVIKEVTHDERYKNASLAKKDSEIL